MTEMKTRPRSPLVLVGQGIAAVRAGLWRRLRPGRNERWDLEAFVSSVTGADLDGSLGERLLRAMMTAADSESGAIWASHPSTGAFIPMASLGMAGPLSHVSARADLPRYLARTGRVVEIAECGWDPDGVDEPALPPWMSGYGEGWLVIPLIHRGGIEGFVMLCRAPSRPLGLLTALATLAASYLAEARLSREISDARNLSDYIRRSAFVRHDVKTVLGQMSLMLQNAQRYGDDPQFQRDMLITVGAAVARLRGMQNRLDQGGRVGRPRCFNLVGIAAAAAAGFWRQGRVVEFHADSAAVMVLGQADRLATVLDHLIGNGFDAAGPEGTVRIVVTSDGTVEIVDTGPGMTADFIRDRLFRPLETDKPDGSGIGAFQAAWLVREMNGCLEVDSEVGGGTTVRIRLLPIPVSLRRERVSRPSFGGAPTHSDQRGLV